MGIWIAVANVFKLTYEISQKLQPRKQEFRVKKLVTLPPQLELVAVFSRKSEHNNLSEQFNHICPYRKFVAEGQDHLGH